MSKAVAEIAVGVALVALVIVAPYVGIPLASSVALGIGATGGSLVLGGIGTLLTKQMTGLSASVRNPIQPWNVVYGQSLIGGTVVFLLETGESDKYLHTVYVLACHPCQAIDAVMFDGKRIPLDADGNSISFQDSTPVIGSQKTVSIASIARTGDVVIVLMASSMPLPAVTVVGPALATGDSVKIHNVSTDATLNGIYQITVVDDTTFTFVSGGSAVSISGEGQVTTTWPDYGDTVHAEFALGTQTSNPFPGLEAGDDTGSQGLWTSAHALQGRCAIYLRLKFGGDTYQSGLPTINFVVSGKADIYDPRTGTSGYTTNAALCIADYLSQPTWGFNALYGSEIPLGPLAAGANICDEAVDLASGATEPRYTCNGPFQLSAKRSEILQNLLTACAGRLSYTGGQFVINPGAWTGTAVMMAGLVTNDDGSPAETATLYVLSSHTPGDPETTGAIGHVPAIHPIGLIATRYWMGVSFADTGAWTLRTDSMDVPVNYLAGLNVAFGINTGILGSNTDPEVLKIYDCWIDVTYEDTTTGTFRPTTTSINTTLGGGGTITDPDNAVDGDPSTYASISLLGFGPLNFSRLLVLGSFNYTLGAITSTPVLDTTLVDIAAGPFQWQPKLATRDLYNGIRATYISPANNWQSTDMPPYAMDELHGYDSDALLAEDGGERRWKDIQLPFTKSVATAQRLAKIELLRSRQQGVGTFAYNLAMYQVTALDIVSMTLPYLGWTDKLLEVTAHRFTVNRAEGDAGAVLGTEIDVQETDPSIYDWSTSEELAAGGNAQSVIGPSTVAAPTGGTVTTGGTVSANVGGVQQSRVKVCWPAPTDGYVINGGSVIVQYTETTSPLGNWLAVGTFDSSTTCAYLPSVSDGTSYTVRIAYVSAQGIQSDWTVLDSVVAAGSTSQRWDFNIVPAGTKNGLNDTFTLLHTPNPASSLRLSLSGVDQLTGRNFTLSGETITFAAGTALPKATDDLRATYMY